MLTRKWDPSFMSNTTTVVEVVQGAIRSHIAAVVDKNSEDVDRCRYVVRILNGVTSGIADLVLSFVVLLILPEQHELDASGSVKTPIRV